MDSKRCPKCYKVLPSTAFNKVKWHNKNGEKEGLKYVCKQCQYSYQSDWRAKNLDKIKRYREEFNKKRRKLPVLFKSQDYKQCATCGNVYEHKDFPVMGGKPLIHCRSCYKKKCKQYRLVKKIRSCTT